jgi:DNA-binding NarL/FixJ family response regulator
VFQPDSWENALRHLAKATHSRHAQLVAFGGPKLIPFNITSDIDPSFSADFAEIDGGSADVNWRVACAGSPLKLTRESDYRKARAQIYRGHYEDFVSKYDIPYGCQCVLEQKPGMMIGLATLRAEEEGWSSPEDCEAFMTLAPHVLEAVRNRMSLGLEVDRLLIGAFEAMKEIVFFLDGCGRVQALTAAAEKLVLRADVVHLAQKQISAIHPLCDLRFQKAISAVLSGQMSTAEVWLTGKTPLAAGANCRLIAYPDHEHDLGFAPRVLMVMKLALPLNLDRVATLTEQFGLSPAEAEVAIAIANGLSRDMIAAQRKTSRATVNEQFKAIFLKLDFNREVEVAAFINQYLR